MNFMLPKRFPVLAFIKKAQRRICNSQVSFVWHLKHQYNQKAIKDINLHSISSWIVFVSGFCTAELFAKHV